MVSSASMAAVFVQPTMPSKPCGYSRRRTSINSISRAINLVALRQCPDNLHRCMPSICHNDSLPSYPTDEF